MLGHQAPLLIAIAASALIAFLALRVNSLSVGGAGAALAIGTLALRASYGTGSYLIVWFALATVLSRLGKARKERLTREIVEKSSQRDAWQVLANGGVFAALIVASIIFDAECDPTSCHERMLVMAAASLAAAGADTWATEVGTLVGGTPWSVRTAARVPTGTSGAVTLAGTLAMGGAALTLALVASLLGVVHGNRGVIAVASGGVAGAVADTLLGAWMQERRWCPRCTAETEQRRHRCGTATVHRRGLLGLNNDAVNFICTIVGATVALSLVLV